MSAVSRPLFIGCDNLVEIDSLIDESDGSAITTAVPSFVLKDSVAAAVSGSAGTMSYVAGTTSRYQGVLPSTLSLTDQAGYTLEVTISMSGKDDFRKIPYIAQYRQR